jgi:hypothetical protein
MGVVVKLRQQRLRQPKRRKGLCPNCDNPHRKLPTECVLAAIDLHKQLKCRSITKHKDECVLLSTLDYVTNLYAAHWSASD